MGVGDATSTELGDGGRSGNRSPLTPIDRVTLEIEGAKLNVAIQNALRRRRSQYDKSPTPGRDHQLEGSERSHKGIREALEAAATSHGDRAFAGHETAISTATAAGSSHRMDAASTKECGLLKAAVESLRAGLRDKEDAVTELEREKEILVEQTSRLDSAIQDGTTLRQKNKEMESQVERLESKLAQAEAGRALTMSLVDTLKSAQSDLRKAHGQVSQRCAELENVAEDASEAVRRGDILLHSQHLKVDAQCRQLKRQEGELAALREERELQLTKADQAAAELAQVLRRESSGKTRIAEAQAATEELKGELESMKEAFARHRNVVRKNQEVIDSHERALQDARSELLSLALEAEKQTSRHQQATVDAASEMSRITGEKDAALRENRALRVENESLKDRLEDSRRKLEPGVAATAAAAAVKKTNSGKQSHEVTTLAQRPYPSPRFSATKTPPCIPTHQPSHPPSQQHPQNTDERPELNDNISNLGQPARHVQDHQHSIDSVPRNAILDCGNDSNSNQGITEQLGQGNSSSANVQWRFSDLRRLAPHAEDGSIDPAPRETEGWMFGVQKHNPSSSSKAAADAGAGGAGGGDAVGGWGKDACRVAKYVCASEDKEGNTHVAAYQCDQYRDAECSSKTTGRSRPRGEMEQGAHDNLVRSPVIGTEDVSNRKSRKIHKGDADSTKTNARREMDLQDEGRAQEMAIPRPVCTKPISSSRPSSGGSSRSVRNGCDDDRSNRVSKARDCAARPSPSTSVSSSGTSGVCPCCGESPYGLMINCSGCTRQHHSACVPEGQKVGKGLGVSFRCSECTSSNNS